MSEYVTGEFFEMRAKLKHEDGCPLKDEDQSELLSVDFKDCKCDSPIQFVEFKNYDPKFEGDEWVKLPMGRSQP